MKNKKDFYLNLFLIIAAPVAVVAGTLMVVLSESNRLTAFGYALILFGVYFFLMWLIRVLAMRSVNKRERSRKELEVGRGSAVNRELDEALNKAFKAVQERTDYPETNTVKIMNAGMEFFAEGRYVCEKDFKDKSGYHLAFEINSTALKYKPEDYDDVCDLEGCGVLVAAGYSDGEALEEYANENGVILQDSLENSVGQTLALRCDSGYSFYVTTAETDDADCGFVKILRCEDGVLTVYFVLNVPFGLNDMVEGTVELNKETDEEARGIDSLIAKIKRKRFNATEVSDEKARAIEEASPFLPESYIKFLREVGFADMDWIDLGWYAKTPTNLVDEDLSALKDVFADCEDYYFFGIDNDGGYYAFSRNAADGKVYNFSGGGPDVFTYESFEDFLYEILNV